MEIDIEIADLGVECVAEGGSGEDLEGGDLEMRREVEDGFVEGEGVGWAGGVGGCGVGGGGGGGGIYCGCG